MKPFTKKIVLASCILMGAGLLLTGAGFAAGGFPGYELTPDGIRSSASSGKTFELKKTKIDPFTSAHIQIDSEADIKVLTSKDNNFYLEYLLDGDAQKPEWSVSGDTFSIIQEDRSFINVAFFGFSDFSAKSPYIRLYVPEGTKLDSLNITSSYGNAELKGIKADQFDLYLDYGDAAFSGCILNKISAELSTGDFSADNSDFKDLQLVSGYGDASLENMTVRSADLSMDAGDLFFDAEGLEKLTGSSEYGDSEFVLHAPLDSYSVDLSTEMGDIRLPDNAGGKLVSDFGEMQYEQDSDSAWDIEFTAEGGDIKVQVR